MPINLNNQKSMRPLGKLPFCYLCGGDFDESDTPTKDHVPPSSLFKQEDRDFPLILPTHHRCNNEWSKDDQLIKDLVGILHRSDFDTKKTKLQFQGGHFPDGSSGVTVSGLDLRSIIRRCVKGFHAALYGEPLRATEDEFLTIPPVPEASKTPEGVKGTSVQPVVPKLVETIKCNRLTKTLDRIVCRNDKCLYECVWCKADDGRWVCIYAFDLYSWKELGDDSHFDARGCVGLYLHNAGQVPPSATRETDLHFQIQNIDMLDPFGT